MSARAWFRKNVPTETLPIVAIVSGAVVGAGYYLFRLSQGPEVTWNRKGDWRPWDKIQQDQNIKFLSVNKEWWSERKARIAEARAAAASETTN